MAKFLSKINSPDYIANSLARFDADKNIITSGITIESTWPEYSLGWLNGTVQQKILITDNSTPNDAVFTFQQSTNSGTYFTSLLTIKDNGDILANNFVGKLTGTASNSKYSQYIKISKANISVGSNTARYAIFSSNPTTHTNGYIEINPNISYILLEGDATHIGLNALVLGNNITEGNADNSEGQLKLYTSKTGDDVIKTTPHELTVTHTLPNKSGILLNTGNYMNYALPLSGGTITGNLIVNGTIEGKTTITADTDLITKSGIVNLNDNALIQYNETNECIEFIFN